LPTYPNTPSIEYKNVFYRESDTTNYLTIEINFRDGNGDLGLHKSFDAGEPYNAIWYYLKSGKKVDTKDTIANNYILYSDRNTPPYDTLPPYEFPYDCVNYIDDGSDIFYITKNPNYNNIFVNFYVKKNGEFVLFDWVLWNPPNCGESYHGRFPILNESGQNRPLEGSLKYEMAGVGFEVIFKFDTLKLEIQIQDRALNKSNIVETPEFVLRDITIN